MINRSIEEIISKYVLDVSSLYCENNLCDKIMKSMDTKDSMMQNVLVQIEDLEKQAINFKKNLLHEFELYNLGKIVKKVSWEIIPDGQQDWYFEELNSRETSPMFLIPQDKRRKAEIERVKFFNKLREEYADSSELNVNKGTKSLSDYYVLRFEKGDFIIFESFKYGNAIYIVRGDWRLLSQMTKKELIRVKNAEAIEHGENNNWRGKIINRIKNNLNYS